MSRDPDIDAALVRLLVQDQFPQWAELTIRPIEPSGWDNRNFRLGDDKIVRLPSAAHYALQVEKEQHWLPKLAPKLPLPIPEPLAMGQPGHRFPWHWSVYGWLDGETAQQAEITDSRKFARSLAQFIRALHRIDSGNGPRPGAHNFHRGGPLMMYDAEARSAIAELADERDAEDAMAIWSAALGSRWDDTPRWLHGDLAPTNLLVTDGALSAVIDFGCCGVGDPSCDLAIAWTFFNAEQRRVFRTELDIDDDTWRRGSAWALWKAAIVLAGLPGTNPSERDTSGTTLRRILESRDLTGG
ncbi:MAG: aminoglycoside phosphotransferase family protein [Parasphingopyxis sp.]|uniref:aminoglycoside phosphotransferase family protein n=1 Tax=Parasphingopyxis sp. TaxID=1920299 RepID=UPI003FA07A2A